MWVHLCKAEKECAGCSRNKGDLGNGIVGDLRLDVRSDTMKRTVGAFRVMQVGDAIPEYVSAKPHKHE
jgi:hypothetical protein